MKKIVTSLYLLCCVCMCQLHAANNVVDSLLSQLDHVIQNRPVYIEQKEKKLNDLRQALRQRISDENRFTLLGEYLDEYRSYNTDSSLYISRERYQVALRMKNKEHQDNALMNTAEIMGTAGMYKEAVDLMHNVQINHLPDDLHPYYYHIYRTVYGLMADYAVTEQEKKLYAEITDRYRDSLLLVNKDNLLVYTLIQSDQHNVRGEFDKAIQLLTDYLAGQIDNARCGNLCLHFIRIIPPERRHRKREGVFDSFLHCRYEVRSARIYFFEETGCAALSGRRYRPRLFVSETVYGRCRVLQRPVAYSGNPANFPPHQRHLPAKGRKATGTNEMGVSLYQLAVHLPADCHLLCI